MDDPASIFLLLINETIQPDSGIGATTFFNILLVVALVVANGFFVAAEFAFVAVRKSRIHTLAQEGNRTAQRLELMLGNHNAYLSASQLGITLASLGLGWVGEPAIASLLERFIGDSIPTNWLHVLSFFIAFTIITCLHIVLGEQAPKLFGLQRAERVALATALPMTIFYRVFKPFINALDWVSAKIVRLFGINVSSEHASIYTEDEIKQLIRISEESGHVNKEESTLINKVFEFSETTVKEAMIPRTEIVAVAETCTLEDISNTFSDSGYSRPVFAGVVGKHESAPDVAIRLRRSDYPHG